jgi:hypothetical protein
MRRILLVLFALPGLMWAQSTAPSADKYPNTPDIFRESKFAQLEQRLPSPNGYRSASGAPGPDYWQQKADYVITAELDEANNRITGSEVITYTNNSPDVLTYLWLQLDQNNMAKNGDALSTRTGTLSDRVSFEQMARLDYAENFDGGYRITKVALPTGQALKYTIVKTMMRVELPTPLRTGQVFSFAVDWTNNINDARLMGNRTGYEFFEKDGNHIYEIAHWFPRMAVYADNIGWNHKQFLGTGEFAVPFGDYKVSITVPADHVVAATGELQNASQVLTAAQQQRFAKARTEFTNPVLVVTPDEAKAAEGAKSKDKKTWTYVAKRVRDFAFASSRKFIWDAMATKVGANTVMSMSYYPNEGNPLWEKYSTQVVAHTIKMYSKHTVDYTYPVAISVNGPIGGMEYPMICFNGPRPNPDGTYSSRTKYGLIGVIIHEVGHNFFPMIINSDERQWTWMDEGLNSFVEELTAQAWEKNYPSRRLFAKDIVPYMSSDPAVQNPIMTNSESVIQLGNNGYGKPAIALNILRETVLGRELFDYAFKEYARRWAYKHPAPADFFRTMEDASGVDLDWYWRGWFYTTEKVDIEIAGVKYLRLDSQDPDRELALRRSEDEALPKHPTKVLNALATTVVDERPELADFYNKYDPFKPTPWAKEAYDRYLAGLNEKDKAQLKRMVDKHVYQIDLKNVGGLVMPVIFRFDFEDGTSEEVRIPAEIWRLNWAQCSKVFTFDKPLKQVVLDPHQETADVDESNNVYPPKAAASRFQLFKQTLPTSAPNPMQLERKYSAPKTTAPSGSN